MSGNVTVSPGSRKEGRALGAGCLYLPSCREEVFSETGLAANGVLGYPLSTPKACSETRGWIFLAPQF